MENTLITQDRLDSLVELCGKTDADVIVEVGVYKGGSLKVLAESFPHADIVGFDTFEGLPSAQWREEEIHQPGDFNDTSKQAVEDFINCNNVELVEGLFPESAETGFEYVDFVHVDTDFYEGVKVCLEYFYPLLPKGGIMVFDDYGWSNCPGVKQALEEFGEPIHESVPYQAYIIKS